MSGIAGVNTQEFKMARGGKGKTMPGIGGVNLRLYLVIFAAIILSGVTLGIIQAVDTTGTTQNPLFVILGTPLILALVLIALRNRVKGTGLGSK